jgi:thymidylate synthase
MNVLGNGPAFFGIDAIQRWAFERLLASQLLSAPRGLPTHELLGQTFSLVRPRARIVLSPARRWSLPLAIGEFCWHASASDDVEALAYYAPRWRAFAEDGRRVRGSCYGHRIFGHDGNDHSPWDKLIALLRTDPASRRAVIDLAGEDQLDPNALDISCTSTFQAFIRRGSLHVIVQMRSNDAVWGLPYDIFLFTMLQEMLALTLGVEVGTYMHGAGSLHLYEPHVPLALRVLEGECPSPTEMPAMGSLDELPNFLAAERAIRRGEQAPSLSPYWQNLARALCDFAASSRGGRLIAS